MQFTVRRLRRLVRISGHSIGGWRSWVALAPPEGLDHQHHWRLHSPGYVTPITPGNVVCDRLWNLAVSVPGETRLHTLEHLIFLRHLGLFGATIYTGRSAPYDGTGEFFSGPILPRCESRVEAVPVFTVWRTCGWTYPAKTWPRRPAGYDGGTFIEPRDDGQLILDITVDYLGLGKFQRRYVFPNDQLVLALARTHSQGWPRWTYWPSRLAGHFRWWRHHCHACWPQEHEPRECLKRFCDHRAFDLLGALALLLDGRWLSANVTSICSGHKADLQAVRLASQNRSPLDV